MFKSKKQIVSLTLIIFMLLSIFNVNTAFAAELENPTKSETIDEILTAISNDYKNSSYEWSIMDMVALGKKSDLSKADVSSYINTATELVNKTKTITDFGKVAIIFTSLGLDPREIPAKDGSTIDIIDKIATAQKINGINDAAFALLAYDSGSYEVNEKIWTRKTIIDYIKDNQHDDGGWALSNDKTKASDPDMTSMAISALAPYYNADEDTYSVKETVVNAINCMSSMQRENGKFASWNTENANSAAMVITSLSSLGIDADKDARFAKTSGSAIDGLLAFKTSDNKFGYNNTKYNSMATEQGFRALIAYKNFKEKSLPYNVYKFDAITEETTRPEQVKTVSIRIEGISENKLNLKDKKLIYNSQTLTVTDVIKNVLEEKDYIYTVGDYGGYFSTFYGESASTFNENYDGWQYRVNGKSPSFGFDGYNVADKDEILVYYGGMNIQYPNEPIINYDNGKAVIKFTAEEATFGGPPNYEMTVATVPIENATITWGYENNKHATYITNNEGEITIPVEQAGNGSHSVKIEKLGENQINGKRLPLVVRFDNDFKLNLEKQTNITEESKEINVSSSDPNIVYNIPKNVNAVIKTTTSSASGGKVQSTLPSMTVQKSNDKANFVMDIQANTKVTANNAWDGKIELPTIISNPTISGEKVSYVIKVGSDLDLTFNKAVRILLPEAKDKRVGFINANGDFTEITKVMTQDNKDGLAYADEEGKINVGDDLAIWTKHFTIFAVLDEKDSGGGSSGGGSASQDIKVSFKLVGDSKQTWISTTNHTVPKNSTVKYVFEKALKDADISYVIKGGNYVSSINGLKEFDNGPNSGWKYKINGSNPSLGFAEYVLKNNDEILWYYTDDYTKEEGSEQWQGGGNSNSQVEPVPEENTNKILFNDVLDNSWAKEYIYYLANKGILNGKSENTFAPKDNITRAEFISILYRMSGEKLEEISNDFEDVKSSDWYATAVNFGIKANITNGISKTSFAPNDNITREQMATMIYNFAKYMKYELSMKNEDMKFVDSDVIAEYAKESVSLMQRAGIINGKGNDTFAPKDTATREEAAKMLAILVQEMTK